MMKLLLSLTLIWALSSTGEALVCQTCTTSACNVTVPLKCSSETMCITAALEVTSEQQIIKGCASSSVCPAIGFHTYSINLGGSSALVYAFCCDTDNCNSATLPFPAVPAANSLQCYSCDTSDCNNPLQCKGTEDRCFQTSDVTVFKCVRQNYLKRKREQVEWHVKKTIEILKLGVKEQDPNAGQGKGEYLITRVTINRHTVFKRKNKQYPTLRKLKSNTPKYTTTAFRCRQNKHNSCCRLPENGVTNIYFNPFNIVHDEYYEYYSSQTVVLTDVEASAGML
ncbi:putative integumentary mucin C.1-like [Scophthalmus maximus]|uniref:Putative integumentary mucin C.1-like n=1 Tax=Scophthalmus maximus TaxID=52904 RepID=A0A2U9C1I4_SCOMX|nr:putative integumentary mucin C.1-like [Scophthalmus maximus]